MNKLSGPTLAGQLLSAADVEANYGISPRKLRDLRKQRLIAYVEIGPRYFRYPAESVERYLQSRLVKAMDLGS